MGCVIASKVELCQKPYNNMLKKELFQKKNKQEGGGRRVMRTYFLENPHPCACDFRKFHTKQTSPCTAKKLHKIVLHPLEILRTKIKISGNHTFFFS